MFAPGFDARSVLDGHPGRPRSGTATGSAALPCPADRTPVASRTTARTGPRPGDPSTRDADAQRLGAHAMARYRGRHRAPSTTGRTIARTALAGAVAGAPLLAAAPAANAAPDSVWDRVAQCESSGNWNINTGNGFFGGLQFTSVDVAGLRRRAVRRLRQPGQPRAADHRGRAGARGPGLGGVAGLLPQGRGHRPGRSRCATAPRPRPSPRPPPRPSPPPQPAAAVGEYVVQRGDTLSSIAARQHVAGGYRALLAKNPALKNPNRIFPGQHDHALTPAGEATAHLDGPPRTRPAGCAVAS